MLEASLGGAGPAMYIKTLELQVQKPSDTVCKRNTCLKEPSFLELKVKEIWASKKAQKQDLAPWPNPVYSPVPAPLSFPT